MASCAVSRFLPASFGIVQDVARLDGPGAAVTVAVVVGLAAEPLDLELQPTAKLTREAADSPATTRRVPMCRPRFRPDS
jgi:hypothetical protein